MTTQQLFAQGTEAFVRYQAELKDGTTFQNMEYIQVPAYAIPCIEGRAGKLTAVEEAAH
jgi:hypothetical protein